MTCPAWAVDDHYLRPQPDWHLLARRFAVAAAHGQSNASAIQASKQVAGVPMFRWHILPDNGRAFWDVLKRHDVLAYVCSHIIAYDVQVHHGVLQVCTAGAGTNWGPDGAMPGATEYLHLLQGALDEGGLRYQVIDSNGSLREWLQWPVRLSATSSWQPVPDGTAPALPKPAGWDARPD